MRTLELEATGVVCAPALGVQDEVLQLVLDGGLFVAGNLWSWRKGPEILKAARGRQSRDKGRIVCLEVMRQPGQAVVRKAPSPQSCCS